MRAGAFVSIVAAVAALVTGLPAATDEVIAYRIPGGSDFSHRGPNLLDGCDPFKPESSALDLSVLPTRLYAAGTETSRVLGCGAQ